VVETATVVEEAVVVLVVQEQLEVERIALELKLQRV